MASVMGSGGPTGGRSSSVAAFLSMWGLSALGLAGAFSFLLAAQGLWLASLGRLRDSRGNADLRG